MNDLLRPALYDGNHQIIPVLKHELTAEQYDIVGPICETGDFFGKDRALAISTDDCLAVRTTGAYGFTMSSNYNSRPRCAEVLVDGDKHHLIRKRETIASLFEGEMVIE